MYPTSSDGLNKETDEAIYFFTPAFYPLDNYSAHQVEIWGIKFPTAEHAYQWKKFSAISPDIAQQILAANSPEAVKRISEAKKDDLPSEWHDKKVQIMTEILRAKANQNEDVRETLQKSGQRQIHENSPVHDFWGLGPKGTGQSMVGEIWMQIRKNYLQ